MAEDVAEHEVFVQAEGRYKLQFAGRVQLAAGQIQPVVVRGNHAQVCLAAVDRRRHGPLEIFVVDQVSRNASGFIGADPAICGRHIHHHLAFFHEGRPDGGVLSPGDGPVHSKEAFETAGDADHIFAIGELNGPCDYFLRQWQRGLHSDGVHRPCFMSGNNLEHLFAAFAMKGHAESGLFRGRRTEAVERQKVTGSADRIERFSVAQQELGEGAPIGERRQFYLVVGDYDRHGGRNRTAFSRLIVSVVLPSGYMREEDKRQESSKYPQKSRLGH